MRGYITALLCLVALPAAAGTWQLQDGSTFTFEASFEGAPLQGQFADFDVTLDFDPDQADAALLHVTVNLAGADMGDPDMNAAIAAPEWFDIDTYPQARFDSDDIVETSPGSFVAHGVLVLKGAQRNIDVPFTWSATGDLATMRGELTLKRSDFDIGSGEWASGDQIGIDVSLRFALQMQSAD